MFLSENLKKCRTKKSLSLEELAVALNNTGLQISRQTIANWESGVSTPNGNDIALLSEFFERPIPYFFD